MKVNVSVEATAHEMREFLGLPNVQPLHDDILKALRENMQRGVVNFDALSLFKPLLPTQFHSMEMVQKFWEAVAKASGAANKDNGDRKLDGSEASDSAGSRNDAENQHNARLSEHARLAEERIWRTRFWWWTMSRISSCPWSS